jgi:hypothetical protein
MGPWPALTPSSTLANADPQPQLRLPLHPQPQPQPRLHPSGSSSEGRAIAEQSSKIFIGGGGPLHILNKFYFFYRGAAVDPCTYGMVFYRSDSKHS